MYIAPTLSVITTTTKEKKKEKETKS